MDTLSISTGEKRIAITRDGQSAGELIFNPSDILFAEKFYKLIGEFQERLTEYQAKAKELEENNTANGNDLPANMQARIDLMKEACGYIHEKIDSLFGAETSRKVFNGVISLDAITQFFEGVTPFIQKVRVEKVARYTNKKPKRTK